MPDKLTPEALRDETALRLEIGRVLMSGPWRHRGRLGGDIDNPKAPRLCSKCGNTFPQADEDWECDINGYGWAISRRQASNCEYPDPWVGDLAIAAELLLRKCLREDLEDEWEICYAIRNLGIGPVSGVDGGEQQLHWWLRATPAERCIVCLMALEGEQR